MTANHWTLLIFPFFNQTRKVAINTKSNYKFHTQQQSKSLSKPHAIHCKQTKNDLSSTSVVVAQLCVHWTAKNRPTLCQYRYNTIYGRMYRLPVNRCLQTSQTSNNNSTELKQRSKSLSSSDHPRLVSLVQFYICECLERDGKVIDTSIYCCIIYNITRYTHLCICLY